MKQYDVVKLLIDIPDHGLVKGDLGTVLEADKPGVLLVEFDPTDKDDLPVISVRSSALSVSSTVKEAIAA